ncbi:MAG TPA: [protein-PII] uridylyltransferase [Methylococcaceae bacterium]|nr:[protein-PII] uridylyltransferase [Methylococcaceae bacterium]
MSFFDTLLTHPNPVATLRQRLGEFDAELIRLFEQTGQAAPLIRTRAAFCDELLTACWKHFLPAHHARFTLAAVGGYGRGELHPASDIDILIIAPEAPDDAATHGLAAFFQFLWDIGLKPGQSVRSIAECGEEARRDQTVLTNLLEARWLSGDDALFSAMQRETAPDRLWPGPEFLAAKLNEQRTRHARAHHTAFNLEPNVKEGPGGLRDLQMLGWVARRLYGALRLQQLVALGILTDDEYAELENARDFLWNMRFALHALVSRGEERLLFEHQRELAASFGHGEGNPAVESFMQQYFRIVKGVERLNEMLLQLFSESIHPPHGEPRAINARFVEIGGYLQAAHEAVFRDHPPALLELFLLLQRDERLLGVTATTIRLIRQSLPLIDESARRNPAMYRQFMEILRQPGGITHQLRRMNRYGVLAAYLPEFERVVGRMQFDLFHAYTVDEHTLFVVRNLRRMSLEQHRDELPFCHDIFQLIAKPELLYVAGLLHDIAKGSGGDHSQVGEKIAEEFCRRHEISDGDTHLVKWLVRHHLLMSLTAQRKDISAPEVAHEFAAVVGNEEYLHHLYLLTVADIRATNANLWNSWKDALLRELYRATLRAFRRGVHNLPAEAERVAACRHDTLVLLRRQGVSAEQAGQVWRRFDEDYFLRYAAVEIAWHTAALARHDHAAPLVLLCPEGLRGCAEVHVFMSNADFVFSRATATLDQLGLTILHARIITTRDGQALHSYQILERNGTTIGDLHRQVEIACRLRANLAAPHDAIARVKRREPAQIRHFAVKTEVLFHDDPQERHTLMELLATDRPGLLSKVGEVFQHQGVRVHHAQISTIGSRAEDLFLVTDRENNPIGDESRRETLRAAIVEAIGTR